MQVLILGRNEVFEVQSGVKLGIFLDELRNSFNQRQMLIRRILLDNNEISHEALVEKGNFDVSNYESLIIEAVTFAEATKELMQTIYQSTYPQFEDLLVSLITSIKTTLHQMKEQFLTFVELSTSIFNSVENAVVILSIDSDSFAIDDVSITEALEDVFRNFITLRDELNELEGQEEPDFTKVIILLENEISCNVKTLKFFIKKILDHLED